MQDVRLAKPVQDRAAGQRIHQAGQYGTGLPASLHVARACARHRGQVEDVTEVDPSDTQNICASWYTTILTISCDCIQLYNYSTKHIVYICVFFVVSKMVLETLHVWNMYIHPLKQTPYGSICQSHGWFGKHSDGARPYVHHFDRSRCQVP